MKLIIIDHQEDFLPDCKDGKCLKCNACYSEYVAAKMAGELDRLGAVDVPQHSLWPAHCIGSNTGMAGQELPA